MDSVHVHMYIVPCTGHSLLVLVSWHSRDEVPHQVSWELGAKERGGWGTGGCGGREGGREKGGRDMDKVVHGKERR